MMMESKKPLNILIIEDNPGDLLLFEEFLKLTELPIGQLAIARTLEQGIIHIMQGKMDIVFLDLSLPDGNGIESFIALNSQVPNTPIVVFSGLPDLNVAVECISLGAQDYLLKNELNEQILRKSIRYSIERKQNLEKIRRAVEQYELIGRITNDIIWRWDFDTNEIQSPAKALFDYSCDEINLDISWWIDKIHSKDRNYVLSVIQELVDGRVESSQTEYRFRCADGSYKHVFNRAFLLRDHNNKPYALVGAMMDITSRHNLQQELLNQQINHQQQLTEATILGQEKEREQIGKELHDNINQILASVNLFLDIAIKNENMKDELLVKCKENTMYAIDEVRKLSHSLMPPSFGENGLIEAVKELIDELNTVRFFKARLSIEDFDESVLDNNKKLMLYRILQEQINNIVKYSRAQEVWVVFKIIGTRLFLTIADNGIGFDTTKKAKGIGLRNIDSRVSYYSGDVNLISAPGKGTSLEVALPV